MARNLYPVSLTTVLAWTMGVLLIATMVVGCGGAPGSDDSPLQVPLATDTTQVPENPSLTRVGDLIEVQLDSDAVKWEDLFNMELKGDYIFANAKLKGQVTWLTVQLPQGDISGPDFTPLPEQAISALQRYSIRSRWGDVGEPDQLFAYDWQENKEWELPAGGYVREPMWDGGQVVWSRYHQGQESVVGYDIETGKSFQVVSNRDTAYSIGYPNISGDWVSYAKREATQAQYMDLFAHNLVTSETLQLGTTPCYYRGSCEPYAMNSNRVAWIERDFETLKNRVHVYDLNTRQDRVVNDPQKCIAVGVELSGHLVAWGCTGHRYGFDLAHNVEFELPLFPPGVESPQVTGRLFSEKWLVWFVQTSQDGPRRLFAMPILSGK